MNTTTVETNPHFQFRWSDISETKFALEESTPNLPVPKTLTYYRSKAFVSQAGINPLIAASAPLFFLIEKIQALNKAPDIEKLHDDLIHEINAFEHQAGISGYRAYVVLAARYVLCSWVDQTVLASNWEEIDRELWERLRLTDAHETEKESPFFLLINRCLQEPNIYIDLLELFYLCLSLGFVGNITSVESSKTKITETRDYLFETILRQREGYSKSLEIAVAVQQSTLQRTFVRPWIRLSLAICAALILSLTYVSLNSSLEAPIHGTITSAF